MVSQANTQVLSSSKVIFQCKFNGDVQLVFGVAIYGKTSKHTSVIQLLKKLSTCLLLSERSVYNSANSKDFQMILVRHRKKAFLALR